jgi:hypothetical protein
MDPKIVCESVEVSYERQSGCALNVQGIGQLFAERLIELFARDTLLHLCEAAWRFANLRPRSSAQFVASVVQHYLPRLASRWRTPRAELHDT